MEYPQGRILVFCKAPEPGAVKTRLQPALSPAQCARLHEQLAQHALQTAVHSGMAPVDLWCDGDMDHPFFTDCRAHQPIGCRQQQGQNLGQRMLHAFETTLEFAEFGIIIGTDCPALENSYLQNAARFLNDGPATTRIVIGPAKDGGYVLIGCNRVIPEVFINIDWGTGRVLQQTRARLEGLDLTYKELEPLYDIDRPEDLQHLPIHLTTNGGH